MPFNNSIYAHNAFSFMIQKIQCLHCFLTMSIKCAPTDSNNHPCRSHSIRLRNGPSTTTSTVSSSVWPRRACLISNATFVRPSRQSSSRCVVYASSSSAYAMPAASSRIRWPRQHSPGHSAHTRLRYHNRSFTGFPHTTSMH